MPSIASSALRLLRQILGSPSREQGPHAGTASALDGNTAVAVTEALLGAGAGLGASFPADTADLAWRAEQSRRAEDPNADALVSHNADGPRGAMAAAIGMSLSGIRATAFLSSGDLAGAQDLLASAAGRHLSLVVHLSNRAMAGHAGTLGSGHEAFHISTDSGCFTLFAANVQEAADFTLIARHVAEQTLIPGLVIIDGEHTALAMQDVQLAGQRLVESFIGQPGDEIVSPSPAQRLLFGDRRRRVPRWYDPDRPVLLGGMQSNASWGLGEAADHVFLGRNLDQVLDQSFRQFAELTGRQHQAISTYRVEDASIVLMAQGAAIETAEAVADHLRSTHKLKVGVLGLRTLRPFPGARISELLKHRRWLLVMERMNSPAATAPPLLREVQAALTGADCPRCLSVVYGLGGLPLRGADLIELCTRTETLNQTQVYLGITFGRTDSPYPKRQVLLDRLRREFPDIARLGLVSESGSADLRPPEALTLAIHRISGMGVAGLAEETAGFLQHITGTRLRSQPAVSAEPWGGYCIDRFTTAPQELRDPGEQASVDLSVLTADAMAMQTGALEDPGNGGLLLLEDTGPGTELPPAVVKTMRSGSLGLYRIAAFEAQADDDGLSGHSHRDYLLGAILGALLDAGLLDLKPRRLLGAREEALQHLPAMQRDVRLNRFNEGLERVHRLDKAALKSGPVLPRPDEDEAPLPVRRLSCIDEAYDSLPRFWDQVGVLYRNGESDQLAADPYMAIGAMPPLSSSFRDLSPLRRTLPMLDPARCDACGACWSQCPDGAVGALALTPVAVLNDTISRAGADALRPMASKLAAKIASLCGSPETDTSNLGELLNQAATWLQDKMPLPPERKEGFSLALGKLQEKLACLPVVATEPFLTAKGNAGKDNAELLFLAINPDACKGCGICVSACEPGALVSATQSRKSLIDARSIWHAWERLPDTTAATLAKAAKDPRIGSMAARLLTRRHTGSLAGGDAAEPGSGERLALRLALAMVESRQGPAIDALIEQVRNTRKEISALIREILADALPTDDLDALSRALETVETRQAELGDFISTAENAIDSGVDAHRLRRLVHLAKDLEDLAWRLSEGRQGFGRARLGMVLSAGTVAEWAGVFPNNPFATPVALDLTGDAAQMAAGLLEGQLQQSTVGFRLMHKARLELEHPEDAARKSPELDRLGWRDLAPEERALCPPLLVIGGGDLLHGAGLSQIDRLLGSDLPIKIILLNELDLGLATQAALDTPVSASEDPGLDLALLALARRNACIAQTSLAIPQHLMRCLQAALENQGPALIHLHAPSPLRHGFAPERMLERAAQAVASRVLPLFLYDPQAEGVFGSRLSLDGNPQPLASWAEAAEETPTPASWALGERRFAGCFTRLPDDSPDALPVDAYLALDDRERNGKATRVSTRTADGKTVRLAVAVDLVRVCEERLRAWRVLQELAGLVTPFTTHVEQTVRSQVAADHASELAAVRAEYEARIEALQGEMLENTRNAMRQRMMQLAGYGGEAKTTHTGRPK